MEVPCSYNGGLWNGSCYQTPWSSDPNDPDPYKRGLWNYYGQTTGALYECQSLYSDGTPSYVYILWLPSYDPPPTTQELEDAARWLLEGTVTAPELGVWPGELGTDESLWPGAVGMPAWFWSKNPGPGIGAPDTKTTTIKGYTIRATATLVKTIWDTGDGNTVTCDLG
ncbi:MAG: hypothetical protein LBK42_11490, partial [Propionibacteriaceae bacterium]|nr:hypothetical protein [Propionibacteriaceae bacterium]